MLRGVFHYKTSSYWGTPPFMDHPIWQTHLMPKTWPLGVKAIYVAKPGHINMIDMIVAPAWFS